MKYSLFFVGGAAVSWLNTQNCREKLTFKVAVAHLALRSPMFGEFCLLFFCVKFIGIDKIVGGFTSKVEYWES